MGVRVADVAVVGGGPAGACCAWKLAREGARVILVDCSSFPRSKVCAGAIGSRGAALLLQHSPITSGELESRTLASHRTMSCWFRRSHLRTYTTSGPPIRVVDRSSLDALLLRRAREAGACIMEADRVVEVTERWVRTSGGRKLPWRFLVGADGAGSLVAAYLRGGRRLNRFGAGVQARLAAGGDRGHGLQVHFGLVSWGYGWMFPRRDDALVGLGGTGGRFRSRELRRGLRPLLQQAGAAGDEPVLGALMPSGSPCRALGRGRVFLVGDAAGLADRISGEGISHAVESGLLVAEAILRGWSRHRLAVMASRGCVGLVSQSRIFAGLLYRRGLQALAMRRLRDDPRFFRGYWDLVAGRTDYWRMILRFLFPRT